MAKILPENHRNEINMLLFGPKESGKTATATSIINKNNAKQTCFDDGASCLIDNKLQMTETEINGRTISILDTPGVYGDNRQDIKNASKKIIDQASSDEYFPFGINAFVLVFSYDKNCNEKNMETVQILKELLVRNWVKSHCVVVFTGGDKLRQCLEEEKDPFLKLFDEDDGMLKELLQECENRFVLFDNLTDNQEKMDSQRQELMDCIQRCGEQRMKLQNFKLVLFGTTGNGRSATVQSILKGSGEKTTSTATSTAATVKSGGGWNSITDTLQVEEGEFDSYNINVVDTSGIYADRKLDARSAAKKIINEASMYGPFDAILLVFSYSKRFTIDEIETIKIMRELLGEDCLKLHGVIVFTGGDNFKRDFAGMENYTFLEWRDGQKGTLKNVLKECENRCVIFDNVTDDVDMIESQRQELINVVKQIKGSPINLPCSGTAREFVQNMSQRLGRIAEVLDRWLRISNAFINFDFASLSKTRFVGRDKKRVNSS